MRQKRVEFLEQRPWREISAPPDVRTVPTMLSEHELSLLYVLARDYADGSGAVVDAGCFLGGSSAALLAGIRDRPEPWVGPPVTSYDMFEVEDYTVGQFFSDPGSPALGDSFRPLYDDHVSRFDAPHAVRGGDIVELGWSGEPIDVLFLDVLKTWQINDAILRDFLPHTVPGRTVIVHQDYGWGQLPWLQITVELMRDSLRWIDAMPYGSHVFLLERPIPEELIGMDVRHDLSDERKVELIDRAIERDDGGSRPMIQLSKATLLTELGRADEAVALVDSVEAGNDDRSVALCIEQTRRWLPPRQRRGTGWLRRLTGRR